MSDDNQVEDFAPWVIFFVTIAGFIFRVLLLESKDLWLDEAISWWVSRNSVGEIIRLAASVDSHPPLYYLCLHGWTAVFGDTVYVMRMLSVLFGAATIPVVYWTGKRMSGPVMGMAAAVFVAFSPFNIRYAQEVRMYTMLTFHAAAAMCALVRLLTDARSSRPIGIQIRESLKSRGNPDDFSRLADPAHGIAGWRDKLYRYFQQPIQAIETDLAWIALIFFTTATLYSHNTAVLFLVGVNLFVIGLMLFQKMRKPPVSAEEAVTRPFRAPSFRNWVLAQLAVVLLWVPWLMTFIRQASRVDQEFWIPKPTREIITQVLRSFFNESFLDVTTQAWIIYILFVPLLILCLWHFRRQPAKAVLLVVMFAAPFLGELIISQRRPIFLDRTLIWATIPLYLALAAGISQIRVRFISYTLLGTIAVLNLMSVSDYLRWWPKEDWSSAAGYVANFAQKGDLVLINSNVTQIPFDFYFEPYEKLYLIEVEKHGLPADLLEGDVFEPIMTTGDIPELIELVSGRERVWLVYSHELYTDPDGLIPRTLEGQLNMTMEREYYGVTVQFYEAP